MKMDHAVAATGTNGQPVMDESNSMKCGEHIEYTNCEKRKIRIKKYKKKKNK